MKDDHRFVLRVMNQHANVYKVDISPRFILGNLSRPLFTRRTSLPLCTSVEVESFSCLDTDEDLPSPPCPRSEPISRMRQRGVWASMPGAISGALRLKNEGEVFDSFETVGLAQRKDAERYLEILPNKHSCRVACLLQIGLPRSPSTDNSTTRSSRPTLPRAV